MMYTKTNRIPSQNDRPYNVLCLHGGGMRGYFSVVYLEHIIELAQNKFNSDVSDLGKQFDLIVGTSVGAILGANLACGISLGKTSTLYRSRGKRIFEKRLPGNQIQTLLQRRSRINKRGALELREALEEVFGQQTLGLLYEDRKIGLVVPTVNMTTHKAWIYKTPHSSDSRGRDNNTNIVDVCLASTAAPIYRSLAVIGSTHFVDGGLWANNPLLVAMIEALQSSRPNQQIRLFNLPTISPHPGSQPITKSPHWGILNWLSKGKIFQLTIDAQTHAISQSINLLTQHINRNIQCIDFPIPDVSPEHAKLLSFDDASEESLDLQYEMGREACDLTNQIIAAKSEFGIAISELLSNSLTHEQK